MLSLITVSHGTHFGSLAFEVETTGSDILRTKEEMLDTVEKLKSARAEFPFVTKAYVSNHELLKEARLKNLNYFMRELHDMGFYVIGVCSPLAVQSWVDLANYKVVSGHHDEYPSDMIFVFNEHLIDSSPEEKVVKFATSFRNVFYNKDHIKDMTQSIKLLTGGQIHNYGFYSYQKYKVGVK